MISFRNIFGLLLLGAALTGCVTGQPLREIAVDSNRLAARTADEQTLLNILRAKDGMPMHFTSFTVLRGSISLEANASLSGSLPESALEAVANAAGTTTTTKRAIDTASPSIGAKLSSSPSFEMAVFDTQEFQRGVLTPVSGQVVEYYLQQGWPEDLLTALLVSHLEVTGPRGRAVWRNHPVEDTLTVFPIARGKTETVPGFSFRRFLEATVMISASTKAKSDELFPLALLGSQIPLGDLGQLDGSKFDVATGSNGNRAIVRKSAGRPTIDFRFVDDTVLNELLATVATEGFEVRDACESDDEDGVLKLFFTDTDCRAESLTDASPTMKIYTRAPEGLLYFLGSYVRYAETRSPYKLPGEGSDSGDRDIIALQSGGHSDALLTVRHRGNLWSLVDPNSAAQGATKHRGPNAIALAQQLVNLQKKAENIPTSNSINLVPN